MHTKSITRNFIRTLHNNIKRNYTSQIKKDVRVRFAPSPTGYLHLGGLRTALYNYLFTKQNLGKFVLRIEDTDQSRLIEGATQQLIEDLCWSGIKIDEGPNFGGDYGPYLQSERLKIYNEMVKKLIDNKTAYYCFCSDHRLNLLRKEALRTRQIPKYDNKCRHLTKDEINEKLNRGEQYCIRFKLMPNCTTFNDLIYGEINHDVLASEGDPIIIKTDKYPTYHFANVVDDHMMKISHVLRGVEWQVSTPKHIMMYRAFNWDPPQYGHLPLLLNSDGTKLSKRQGDIRISSYRETGILPQALINFITYSGGGFNKEETSVQIHSIDKLTKMFNLNKINSHSGRLMSERLDEFNHLVLNELIHNDMAVEMLIKETKKIVTSEMMAKYNRKNLHLDDNHVKSILLWSSKRINKISDLVSESLAFLWIVPELDNVPHESNHIDYISAIYDALKNKEIELNQVFLKKFFKNFAAKNNVEFSESMRLLRMILSGLKSGPGVAEMIEILGEKNTISRFENYLFKFRR